MTDPRSPRAVVLPFGVSEDGRGLGVGAAALVHAFFRVGGQEVAFVQVLARPKDRDDEPQAVEALVPAQAWRDMPGSEDTPESVTTVITGAIAAPDEGRGALTLLAFDRRTLDVRSAPTHRAPAKTPARSSCARCASSPRRSPAT